MDGRDGRERVSVLFRWRFFILFFRLCERDFLFLFFGIDGWNESWVSQCMVLLPVLYCPDMDECSTDSRYGTLSDSEVFSMGSIVDASSIHRYVLQTMQYVRVLYVLCSYIIMIDTRALTLFFFLS